MSERDEFLAWVKTVGDGIFAGRYLDLMWKAWQARAARAPQAVPALTMIREKLARFAECAEDDEDCDIGQEWFDALTTIGLLARVQRSPALWEMTDAGESFLDKEAKSDLDEIHEALTDPGADCGEYIRTVRSTLAKNVPTKGSGERDSFEHWGSGYYRLCRDSVAAEHPDAWRGWQARAILAAPKPSQEPEKARKIEKWGHCWTCGHDAIPGESCARDNCPNIAAEPKPAEPRRYQD